MAHNRYFVMPRKVWRRITLNLTPELAGDAEKRAKDLKSPSFAAYVAQLIRADLTERKWILQNEGETYMVKPPSAQPEVDLDELERRARREQAEADREAAPRPTSRRGA
jgi:hypothetical protein